MTQVIPKVPIDSAPAAGIDGGRAGDLAAAILRTVAYSDVFDFAPTRTELHRFLIGERCTVEELDALLDGRGSGVLDGRIMLSGRLVALAGRQSLFELRVERDRTSARQWPIARRYARAVASLPFVRMVAVTGGLAAGNAVEGGDIDLLVVTQVGRLWLARASSILIVRYAALQGHELCPNYFLTGRALAIPDRDVYAASELVRMVPIAGAGAYSDIRARNHWTATWFPNADGPPRVPRMAEPLMPTLKRAAEVLLAAPPVDLAEAWEERRKTARFREQARLLGVAAQETAFGPDRCKGHFDAHRTRIRAAYEERARALGVEPIW
jgi:hypothetical protein